MPDHQRWMASVFAQLLRTARFVVPPNFRRAFWLWRENRQMPDRPDRKLLVRWILPDLSQPGTTVLWVGCQPYTRTYMDVIERTGAECWTLEIDPAARRWGHTRRHIVGDLQMVGTLCLPAQFDVVLVNGVFGYGLDIESGQNEAIEGLARVLKADGLLMLGWNTHRTSDPLRLPAIRRFFIRSQRPGFEQRITFPESTHVYDFFQLREPA